MFKDEVQSELSLAETAFPMANVQQPVEIIWLSETNGSSNTFEKMVEA